MPVRTASAQWNGSIREGNGKIGVNSGVIDVPYSFSTRFEDAPGTNPEELLGAAHAGCFTMALSGNLGRAGFTPESLNTQARVHIERQDNGFTITKIELITEGRVPGIDEAAFQEQVQVAKQTCPLSKALASVPEITVQATLLS